MSRKTQKQLVDEGVVDDKPVVEDDEIELEIIDDVPEEDKGRPRRADADAPDLPEDDEIAEYSEGVQKRIKKLKWEFHEERRRKEESDRIKEEAVHFAQQQNAELQQLRTVLAEGEKTLAENSKGKAEAELTSAKEKYRKAYEDGDADVASEAMQDIARITGDLQRWSDYKPQYQPPVEQPNQPTQPQQPRMTRQPTRIATDEKADKWTSENPWFGKNQRMTGYAMGLHQDLVTGGVHPMSDDYYERINSEMRRVFPNEFDGVSPGQDDLTGTGRPSTPRQATGTVVAPATRTPKTQRKVQLTATQVALARRLGLTPEQYAAEAIKEIQDA